MALGRLCPTSTTAWEIPDVGLQAERQHKAKLEAEVVKDEQAQKAESARQALEREQRAKAHVIKESKELDELKTLLHVS